MAQIPIIYVDPMVSCSRSIQFIGMHLLFKIKGARDDLLPQNPKNCHFLTKKWPKNGQKMAKKWPKNGLKWPKFLFFYVDPMLPCSTIIKLIGMRLFFKIKEVRVDLLPQNPENGHFSTKNGLKWPKFPFFYVDPMVSCSRSIQLIGMRLFFKIKEVRVNLLPQNPENGLFSTNKWPKNGLKWPKFPFFYVDHMFPCLRSIQFIGMRLLCKIM